MAGSLIVTVPMLGVAILLAMNTYVYVHMYALAADMLADFLHFYKTAGCLVCESCCKRSVVISARSVIFF